MKTCCAVIRHAEREDGAEKCWSPVKSPLKGGMQKGYRYSLDPTLTSRGEALVATWAKQLMNRVQPLEFQVVVTSPYMRCVQTAVQLCRFMGPQVRLLIDDEMGEIYGPKAMGDDEPTELLRPVDEIISYCKSHGVEIGGRRLGSWPSWPETVPCARLRFVKRFLQYLRRAQVTCHNFILVTHGDAVASALNAMPSLEGRPILRVDYGGFFVAQTSWAHALRSNMSPGLLDDDILAGRLDDRSWNPLGWKLDFNGIGVGPSTGHIALGSRISTWSKKTGYAIHRIVELLQLRPCADDAKEEQIGIHPDAGESNDDDENLISISLMNRAPGAATGSSVGESTAYFGGATPSCTPLQDPTTSFARIHSSEASSTRDEHPSQMQCSYSQSNERDAVSKDRAVPSLNEAKPSFLARRSCKLAL